MAEQAEQNHDEQDSSDDAPRVRRYRRAKGNLAQRIVGNRWFVKGFFFLVFAAAIVQLMRFASYALSLVPSITSTQAGYGSAMAWLQYGDPAMSGLPPAAGRPEVVAGLLPVGHFTSFFGWLKGGGWDILLPAGLVIIIAALLVSVLFKRGFCGWICPLGTLWEACGALGHKIMGRNFKLPKWADIPLRVLRYVIAFVFFYSLFSVSIQEAELFRTLPYMFVADVKIIQSFMSPAYIVAFVLAMIGSFFLNSVWCRYLCPLGGLYGPLSSCSPTTITRDEELCIDCGKCTDVCHAFIKVDEKTSVRSPECDGCMDCVHVCPVEGAVEMKIAKRVTIPAWFWPVLVGLVWLLIYLIAKLSGNWDTRIPTETFAMSLATVGESGAFTFDTLRQIIMMMFGMQ